MSHSCRRRALCLSLFLFGAPLLVQSEEKPNECKSLISPDEEELKKAVSQGQSQSCKAGVGVDLSCTDLKGRDLRSFVLCDADLSGADLRGADLRNVDLTGADLTGANLGCQAGPHDNESRCEGKSTNLEGAHLGRADLSRAIFDHALMKGAVLSSDIPATDPAKTSKTDLGDHTRLRNADLTGANLTDVDLTGADMREADLSNAELAKSDMSDVDLEDCIYEPKSSPDVSDIVTSKNLDLMTYERSPSALAELRKKFGEAGSSVQAREISSALMQKEVETEGGVAGFIKEVAFGLTIQYGSKPDRALKLWFWLFVASSLLYAFCIRFSRRQPVVCKVEKPDNPNQPAKQTPIRADAGFLPILFWAGFLSLMNALSIGFKDEDVGRWLRLLPRSEYELKAKGWVRSFSGVQMIASNLLLALWIVSYGANYIHDFWKE